MDEDLVAAALDADLLVAEAYFFDKKIKLHLDLESLQRNLPRMHPRRMALTHMSDDMIGRVSELPHEFAYDGLRIELKDT